MRGNVVHILSAHPGALWRRPTGYELRRGPTGIYSRDPYPRSKMDPESFLICRPSPKGVGVSGVNGTSNQKNLRAVFFCIHHHLRSSVELESINKREVARGALHPSVVKQVGRIAPRARRAGSRPCALVFYRLIRPSSFPVETPKPGASPSRIEGPSVSRGPRRARTRSKPFENGALNRLSTPRLTSMLGRL